MWYYMRTYYAQTLLYNMALENTGHLPILVQFTVTERWATVKVFEPQHKPANLASYTHFQSFTIYDVSGRFTPTIHVHLDLMIPFKTSLSLSLSRSPFFLQLSPSLSLSLFFSSSLSLSLSQAHTFCIRIPSSVTPAHSHEPSFCLRWVHTLMAPIMVLPFNQSGLTAPSHNLKQTAHYTRLDHPDYPDYPNLKWKYFPPHIRMATDQLPHIIIIMYLPYMVCVSTPLYIGDLQF